MGPHRQERKTGMEQRRIYLDHNATTPLHPDVRRAMTDAMEVFGNPSSLHSHGREAADLVAESRREVADFIGASPQEIVFVGSGSEANNTVLAALTCEKGACARLRGPQRGLVTTAVEHPCVMETAKCLAARGIPVSFAPVDESGRVEVDAVEELVDDSVAMVSVMLTWPAYSQFHPFSVPSVLLSSLPLTTSLNLPGASHSPGIQSFVLAHA